MRNILIGVVAVGILIALSFTQKSTKDKPLKMENELDTVSYSMGVSIATNLKQQGFTELNTDILARAMKDVLQENDLAIEEKTCQGHVNSYYQKLQQKVAEEQKKAGVDFLAANAKKEGVVVMPSGLQYKVVKEGTGAKPKATDVVKVHYHGTTIDGKVFDSSVERGQPTQFPLNRVIKGWTEGLQYMTTGSKYVFYIPYDLAYGAQGSPPKIPPYSTLIFEVELFEINPQ